MNKMFSNPTNSRTTGDQQSQPNSYSTSSCGILSASDRDKIEEYLPLLHCFVEYLIMIN